MSKEPIIALVDANGVLLTITRETDSDLYEIEMECSDCPSPASVTFHANSWRRRDLMKALMGVPPTPGPRPL
jgi:hypothetical protein